jgi:hypothetical protein
LCCISCCVVQKEKRRREGGCGWPRKVPRSPAAHKKRKKRKKPTARYLIDQYGEKGKAIKKNKKKTFNNIGERFEFLEKFLKWLEQWKQMSYGQGFLTLDTYHALSHTTRSLISLIKFLLQSLNVNYVLTGKFQTDNLERTFAKYRNLLGSNYNVSVQQVMEAEHKIRLNKLLGIQSARYGVICINH